MMVGANLTSQVEGISNAVREISMDLIGRGHEIHYLTSMAEDDMIEFPKSIFLNQVDVGKGRGYGERARNFLLRARKQLGRVAIEKRIDIIHCHSSYPAFGTLIGCLVFGLGCGKIISIYSSGKREEGLGDYSKTTRLALKLSKSALSVKFDQHLFDKIVAVSRGVENSLRDLSVPEKKIAFIPIGVDTHRFNPSFRGDEVRDELTVKIDEKLVLFAGDLTPWKGVEVLLHALRKTRKKIPEIRALILTKGTYEFESQRKVEINNLIKDLQLKEIVRIVGRRRDMPSVYSASNVVVLPYVSNFALMDIPRSLMEAMASGKPVIVSKIGGSEELIKDGENGFLVRPGCPEELAEKMMLILSKQELEKKIGEEARKTIEVNYSLESTTRKLDELYKKL
ncbi:MAG: glycosyltransferase family 4 protein [Thermoproteota archaeon]